MDITIRPEFMVFPERKGSRGPKPQSVFYRFMKHVERSATSDCWIWTGSTTEAGYGKFLIGSHADNSRQWVTANSLMWQMVNGPMPAGYEACHTCDVRSCVNPEHLFKGTHLINMQDASEKGRLTSTAGLRQPGLEGERHGNSKLTNAEALEIFESHLSNKTLGDRFGISPKTVWGIKNGKRRAMSIAETAVFSAGSL